MDGKYIKVTTSEPKQMQYIALYNMLVEKQKNHREVFLEKVHLFSVCDCNLVK
jgi:hypothetical protein